MNVEKSEHLLGLWADTVLDVSTTFLKECLMHSFYHAEMCYC